MVARWLPEKKALLCSAAFANSHGVNIPTTANFKDDYV